jgi:hypothetical protein
MPINIINKRKKTKIDDDIVKSIEDLCLAIYP